MQGDALLSALLAAGQDKQIGKTAQHNIAQCIAVLCTAAGATQTSNTVKSLLGTVQGNDEIASRLALFSIGEIGRSTDLSKFKQLQVKLPLTMSDKCRHEGQHVGGMWVNLPLTMSDKCSQLSKCSVLIGHS